MKKTTTRALAAGAALGAALLLNAPAHAQYQGQDAQAGRGRWEQQGQRQDPGQRLDRQVAMLTQQLQLSNRQASQIRQILQDEQNQFEAWRRDHGGQFQRGQQGQGSWQRGQGQNRGGWQRGGQDGDRRDGQAQGQRGRRQLPPELQAIRDRGEQQIAQVLTPQQRAQYEQLRAEREQRGQEWGNGRGRGQGNGQYRGGWGN